MTHTTHKHITYTLPVVTLLNESGLGTAEVAARTCYDSFENSENECIQNFHGGDGSVHPEAIHDIERSELLDSLAWVHHHHSIIEHTTLSYLVQGTSRGVLQEHARHRLQSISVRSTRYTMGSVINAFVASLHDYGNEACFFKKRLIEMDLFVIDDEEYIELEAFSIFDRLSLQMKRYGENEFYKEAIAKSSLGFLVTYHRQPMELFKALESGKKKRNVGDSFKHIVSDNWKVDMVVTFNLRSLKNYFDLRDSGAAWFQIRWLAEGMKRATPEKYLSLIDKNYKK